MLSEHPDPSPTYAWTSSIKKIDAHVPAGRELKMRFVEQGCNAPSFERLPTFERLWPSSQPGKLHNTNGNEKGRGRAYLIHFTLRAAV
jgi:hypothetical protein